MICIAMEHSKHSILFCEIDGDDSCNLILVLVVVVAIISLLVTIRLV